MGARTKVYRMRQQQEAKNDEEQDWHSSKWSRAGSLLTGNHVLATIVLFVLFICGIAQIRADDEPASKSAESMQPGEPKGSNTQTGMFATEVWLTPLVLLPGVALLIVSTSARFGQLHDEFHRLLDHPGSHGKILAKHLLRRCALFRDSLVALYASVGLFAFGSLLGGVVNLWRPESLWIVGSSTMVGIGCVVYASVQLVREALICLKILVDHNNALQNAKDESV